MWLLTKSGTGSILLIFNLLVVQSHGYQPSESYKIPPPTVIDLMTSISNFSSDFYQQCIKVKPGNVIVSPFLVANSLALLSQASDGKTFDEIKTALLLNANKSIVADQFAEFFGKLQSSTDGLLFIANQLYIQHGNQLNRSFQDLATLKFASSVELMDFTDVIESAENINHFIGVKTKNEVQNVIQPKSINSDMQIILANAIHFKSYWNVQFNKNRTIQLDFYIGKNETVLTDFMHSIHYFNFATYLDDLQASAVELKCANSSIAFMIVLPMSTTGLSSLEAKMKYYNMTSITSQMVNRKIHVYIPKFKIEYVLELSDVLKNLNLMSIFGSDANLNGILESGSSLKVSTFIQKASIEINEDGLPPSNAFGSGTIKKMSRPTFIADHPFMYFIRDTENNAILFSGRYENVENKLI